MSLYLYYFFACLVFVRYFAGICVSVSIAHDDCLSLCDTKCAEYQQTINTQCKQYKTYVYNVTTYAFDKKSTQ